MLFCLISKHEISVLGTEMVMLIQLYDRDGKYLAC